MAARASGAGFFSWFPVASGAHDLLGVLFDYSLLPGLVDLRGQKEVTDRVGIARTQEGIDQAEALG